MKPQFFPAISTATISYLEKFNDEQFINHSSNLVKSVRFFNSNDKGYFKHPFVLISACHLYKKTPDIRKYLGMDNKSIIFVDSGGYQLASGAVKENNWDNERAFEWSMNNGNIFPILDRPPLSNDDFEKNMKLSVKSAEYYAKHRKSKDNKIILNVVHGSTKLKIHKWLDNISDIPFDGWAQGGMNNAVISTVVCSLLEMHKRGLLNKSKLYHIFGVSSTNSMIYFSIIQNELKRLGYKTRITYDSSYFQRSFAFGNYFLYKKFDGMVNVKLSNRYDWSNIPKSSRLPCDCPLCSQVKDIHNFFDDSMVFYMIGAMHNLYQMITYKKSIESLINFDNTTPAIDKKTGELYKVDPFLKRVVPVRMWNNICAIREAFAKPEIGDEIMRLKYKNLTHIDVNTAVLPGFE